MNKYDISGEIGKCFIKDTFFIFDKEDFEKIKNYTWFLSNNYPSAHLEHSNKIIRLHRLIMDCPANMVVDHINLNKLDNRKTNLRICTRTENNQNHRTRRHNTLGYSGLCMNGNKTKWVARIGYYGKNLYLGTFLTKEEAIKARKEAEKIYFKDFAYKGDSNG